ncbi:hypothetical protein B7463_g10507, partial [Scytalidium lignicola]
MADVFMSGGASEALHSTSHIPIAQLTPLISSPSSKSLKAVVTLTWPYSSVTGSVSFLLAEPDFRLRRTRGQVRVQFSRSSARAVSEAGITSGDEIILCLDGVEWLKDDNPTSTPGRGIEFELEFKDRLLLQFVEAESENVRVIDIDNPHAEPQPQPVVEDVPEEPTPQIVLTNGITSPRLGKPSDEWQSPAFIKRARESYGSLFDLGYDPFAEDDGAVHERRRKRTRLSSSWRYASRSPSPDTEEREEESHVAAHIPGPEEMPTPIRTPTMMDEGCQTVELEEHTSPNSPADTPRSALPMNIESVGTMGVGLIHDRKPLDKYVEPEINGINGRTPPTQPLLHDTKVAPVGEDIVRERSGAPVLGADTLSHSAPDNLIFPSHAIGSIPSIATEEHEGLVSNGRSWPQQAEIGHDTTQQISGSQHNDLYDVTTEGHQRGFTLSAYPGFNSLDVDTSSADLQHLGSHIIPEDRHNHWRHATDYDQARQPLSPAKVAENYEERVVAHGQNDYLESQDQMNAPVDATRFEEFSLMNEGSVVQSYDLNVSTRDTEYPELPEPDDVRIDIPPVNGQLPNVGNVLMSRSLSASSSRVVDLTEGSSEEAESEEGEEQQSFGEEDQDDTAEGTPKVQQAQDSNLRLSKDLQGDGFYRRELYSDGEENDEDQLDEEDYTDEDEDEEQYYDGDMEEEGEEKEEEKEGDPTRPSFRIHPLHQQEHEETGSSDEINDEASYDEASYDEDEDDLEGEEDEEEYEEEQPKSGFSIQKEPVVIDLLSSSSDDDESGDDRPAEEVPTSKHGLMEEDKADISESETSTKNTEEGVEGEEEEQEGEDGSDLDEQMDDEGGVSDRQDLHLVLEQQELARASSPVRDDEDSAVKSDKMEEELSEVVNNKDTDMVDVNNVTAGVSQDAMLSHDLQSNTNPDLSSLPSEYLNHSSTHGLVDSSFMISQLDGNNDSVNYPTLSMTDHIIREDGAFKPVSLAQELSHESQTKEDNAQLPTPADTQLSQSQASQGLDLPLQISFAQENVEEASTVQKTEELVSAASTQEHEQDVYDVPIERQSDQVDSAIKVHDQGEGDGALGKADIKDIGLQQAHIESSEMAGTRGVNFKETSPDRSPIEPNSKEIPTADFLLKSLSQDEKTLKPLTELRSDEIEAGKSPVKDAPVESEVKHSLTADDNSEELSYKSRIKEVQATDVYANILTDADLQEATFKQLEAEESHLGPQAEEVNVNESQKIILEPEMKDSPSSTHRKEKLEEIKLMEDTIEVVEPTRSVPVTPVRNTRHLRHSRQHSGRSDRSESIILDKQTTPKGHDASVELAISVLESPSKSQSVTSPDPLLKHKLARALRTDLSEFTSLKMLRLHLNKKLDVLAIATTTPPEPQRAKSGPRQYLVTFNITDTSIGPSAVTQVQVFRPYKEALPLIEAGDGILLRNFQVISVKGRGFALRSEQTEASSWAVFKNENHVETRGPPVEYGNVENEHIVAMKVWYNGLDSVALAKLAKANGDKQG